MNENSVYNLPVFLALQCEYSKVERVLNELVMNKIDRTLLDFLAIKLSNNRMLARKSFRMRKKHFTHSLKLTFLDHHQDFSTRKNTFP